MVCTIALAEKAGVWVWENLLCNPSSTTALFGEFPLSVHESLTWRSLDT